MNAANTRLDAVLTLAIHSLFAVSMPARTDRTRSSARKSARLVVFVGPSMPHDEARRILPSAEYRAPVRRGDLDALEDSTVVGLIDGHFGADQAITEPEIERAIQRGVRMLGSSGVGALMAARVPNMRGVGRVYELYRAERISGEGEIAIDYEQDSFRRRTCALANVRYAVDQLVRSATIDADVGSRLLNAARELGSSARTHHEILRRAGLDDRPDAQPLVRMLMSFDIEREDAHLLLEQLALFDAERDLPDRDEPDSAAKLDAEAAAVTIWEYGGRIPFAELIELLAVTGALEHHARAALTRMLASGRAPPAGDVAGVPLSSRQDLLLQILANWGWTSSDELKSTLDELGSSFRELRERVEEEVTTERRVAELVRSDDDAFYCALRAQLLLDGTSLKRAALRYVALRHFAAAGAASTPPSEAELIEADHALRAASGTIAAPEFRRRVARAGITQDGYAKWLERVALARRVTASSRLNQYLWGRRPARIEPVRISKRLRSSLSIERSEKSKGSRRFATPMDEAEARADAIAQRIGITRIELLDDAPNGVRVSKAHRDGSGWSSTAGSGKSRSSEGARVGAVLEEAEKYAQERFTYEDPVIASYASFADGQAALDPATLDLPNDSVYCPDLPMGWVRCPDLLQGEPLLVPVAALVAGRQLHDIYYSARHGRKFFSSNGLASGFCAAEAILHALCEVIERHASFLAELRIANPGGLGPTDDLRFVDLGTLPDSLQELLQGLERAGYAAKILHITSEVPVPAFAVRVWRSPGDHDDDGMDHWEGSAAHPDPEVAIEMALLEGAQMLAGSLSASEDSSGRVRSGAMIKARSLGRHQRPRPRHADQQRFWLGDDAPLIEFDQLGGYISKSIMSELEWVLGCLEHAGFEHVIVSDLTEASIRPASVVRVIVPGTETINPYHVGPRARAHALRDLVYPRCCCRACRLRRSTPGEPKRKHR